MATLPSFIFLNSSQIITIDLSIYLFYILFLLYILQLSSLSKHLQIARKIKEGFLNISIFTI